MAKCKVGDRVGFYWLDKPRLGKVEAITGKVISVPNEGTDAWLQPYFWLSESDIQHNYSQNEITKNEPFKGIGVQGRRVEVIQDTVFGIGKINKGERGTILSFRQRSSNPIVRLDSGRIVPIPWQYATLLNSSTDRGDRHE